jgi:hypothetical protein
MIDKACTRIMGRAPAPWHHLLMRVAPGSQDNHNGKQDKFKNSDDSMEPCSN